MKLYRRNNEGVIAQAMRNIMKNLTKEVISNCVTNSKKRLEFALEHICKPWSFWDKTVFVCGSGGRTKVCGKLNTKLQARNLITAIKYGSESAMLWFVFLQRGINKLVFIEGTMSAKTYIHLEKKKDSKVLKNWCLNACNPKYAHIPGKMLNTLLRYLKWFNDPENIPKYSNWIRISFHWSWQALLENYDNYIF